MVMHTRVSLSRLNAVAFLTSNRATTRTGSGKAIWRPSRPVDDDASPDGIGDRPEVKSGLLATSDVGK